MRTKTDAIPVIGALRYIVRTTRAFARFPPAYQRQCRRFLVQVLRHTPESLPVAFYFVMAGYHYYRFTFEDVVPDLQRLLAEEPAPSGASETLDAAA